MENKVVLKLVTLLIALFLLTSCGNIDNPKERNKLVFVDTINSVSDSIRAMNGILLKQNKFISTFVVHKNILYIDDSSANVNQVGDLNDSLLYKNNKLFFIESKERKRFIKLVSFLNKNYLGWCVFRNNQFLYQYRADIYMADRQIDLERFVGYSKAEQEIDFNFCKILDRKENLYLLADKKAKIW